MAWTAFSFGDDRKFLGPKAEKPISRGVYVYKKRVKAIALTRFWCGRWDLNPDFGLFKPKTVGYFADFMRKFYRLIRLKTRIFLLVKIKVG